MQLEGHSEDGMGWEHEQCVRDGRDDGHITHRMSFLEYAGNK